MRTHPIADFNPPLALLLSQLHWFAVWIHLSWPGAQYTHKWHFDVRLHEEIVRCPICWYRRALIKTVHCPSPVTWPPRAPKLTRHYFLMYSNVTVPCAVGLGRRKTQLARHCSWNNKTSGMSSNQLSPGGLSSRGRNARGYLLTEISSLNIY
jgi:hypothetical protein